MPDILQLEDRDRDLLYDRLHEALEGIRSPYEDFDAFRIAVYKAFCTLPDDILAHIFRYRRYPESPGFIYLRNLPRERPLAPTPTDGRPHTRKSSYISEACVVGISLLLGEPIGFESEKLGDLIHNIVPVEANALSQSNEGSRAFLAFHNDTVYDKAGYYNSTNPDYLVLYCLRQQEGDPVLTHFVEAREIVEVLSAHQEEVLRSPSFRMASPSTYSREQRDGNPEWSLPSPVLTGPDDCPEICMAANGVLPMHDEAARVLDQLNELLHTGQLGGHVELTPGDVLLVNNRKGLHARGSYQARFDGSDRWLMRCYVRSSTWSLRDRRTERPGVFV